MEEKDEVEEKSYKEKEEKSISEHLGELKADKSEGKETLASKMPSREPADPNAKFERIKIPVAKRFDSGKKVGAMSSNLHTQKLVFEKDKIDAARKTLQSNLGTTPARPADMPEIKLPVKSGQPAVKDETIFEGKPAVSRLELAREMRRDPKVWKAAVRSGLNLSPVERVNLAKEVLPPLLGRDISKTDLKWSIKKLNKQLLSTQNPQEHAKIRKEIKFFKKIGGI